MGKFESGTRFDGWPTASKLCLCGYEMTGLQKRGASLEPEAVTSFC